MKIVTLIKYVPDATGDLNFDSDGTVDREGGDGLLSELDEYAVEQALRLREEHSDREIEVIAVTMGPEDATDALKRALQMGADAGVHICDDALHGSDAPATSAVLAAAVAKLEPELVLCGMASTDAVMGVVPVMLAERLGWPALTLASQISLSDDTITIQRDDDDASYTISASVPAVASVTDQSGEARYPSMKGILAAKKKPVDEWSLSDLGVDPETVGLAAAWTKVTQTTARPEKAAGTVVVDDQGSGAAALAEFLVAGRYL